MCFSTCGGHGDLTGISTEGSTSEPARLPREQLINQNPNVDNLDTTVKNHRPAVAASRQTSSKYPGPVAIGHHHGRKF